MAHMERLQRPLRYPHPLCAALLFSTWVAAAPALSAQDPVPESIRAAFADGVPEAQILSEHKKVRWVGMAGDRRWRKSGSTTGIAFSPDGAWLVCAGDDTHLRVWETASGRERFTWRGDPMLTVTSFALRPDGQEWALGTGGNHITLWDAAALRTTRTITLEADWAQVLAYAHDGSRLFAGTNRGRLLGWDPAGGGELRSIDVSTHEERFRSASLEGVLSLAVFPDGKRIATGGDDGRIKFWTVPELAPDGVLEAHMAPVVALACRPDGAQFASGDAGGAIRVWNAKERKVERTLDAGGTGRARLGYSADGAWLVAGGGGARLRRWDAATGSEAKPQGSDVHAGPYRGDFALSPDGKYIALARGDFGGSEIEIRDLRTLAKASASGGSRGPIRALRVLPDGGNLFTAGADATVRVWNRDTGKPIQVFGPKRFSRFQSLDVALDGKWLVASDTNGSIWVLDAVTGKVRRTLEHVGAGASFLQISPDGRRVVSGGGHDSGTIKVWDAASGELLRALVHGGNGVRSLAIGPDSTWFASLGRDDQRIRLWELESGNPIRDLVGPEPVIGLAIQADGRRLVSCGRDGAVTMWDVSSGAPVYERRYGSRGRRGRRGREAVAFGGDGAWFAAVTAEARLALWDTATGDGIDSIALDGGANCLAAEGRRIYVGCDDSTVRIYELAP